MRKTATYLLKKVSSTTKNSNEKFMSTPVVMVWKITAAMGVPKRFHSIERKEGSIL